MAYVCRSRICTTLCSNLRASNMSSQTSRAAKLAGKVAVVTAATDGIGLAIARRLGEDGAHVVLSSRKQANVDAALADLQSSGLSVMGLTCHVSKADDRQNLVTKTLEKYGGIDIFVSNAAVNPTVGGLLDVSEQAWDKIFEVNVKNALQLTQLVVPHMHKGGAIVYISSIGGYSPIPMLGAYCVSKTALLGMTKVLAQEVAPNIRVNCVAPGIVDTKFSGALTKNPDVHDKLVEHIPLGRVAVPKEMGGLVSFLVSEDAAYITGETFVAAGGQLSRL